MFKQKTKEELERELVELQLKRAENEELRRLQLEIARIKHPIYYSFLEKCKGFNKTMNNLTSDAKKKMFP